MNSSNFVEGVFVGAIIGLTAGLLLAPDKGTETLKKLKTKGNDLANAVKNKFSSTVEDGEEMLDEAGNKVENWARKGKRKTKDMTEEGKEKFDDLENKNTNVFS